MSGKPKTKEARPDQKTRPTSKDFKGKVIPTSRAVNAEGGTSMLLDRAKVDYKPIGAGDLLIIQGCPLCQGRLTVAGNQPWVHCVTLGCQARDMDLDGLLDLIRKGGLS